MKIVMFNFKNLYALILVLLLSSCGHDPIELQKTEYSGIELMMSGYFVDGQNGEYQGLTTIYIFYRDGTVLYGGSYPKDEYSIEDIEENFKSESFNEGIKKSRLCWGVFDINDFNIKFESWAAGNGKKRTVIRSGEIINQHSFVINTFHNNYSDITSFPNDTFRFVRFHPKPDSTNMFL